MGKESMQKVALEWLQQNATARGGYTKRQLQIVGVAWPPGPGWQARTVGNEITCADAAEFERIAAVSKNGGGR